MSAADGMMLWTGDYLADTQHLTTTQHGAYLLLMMALWRNGGYLPLDEMRLAKIVKMPVNRWRATNGDIMELMTVEGDRFTQKRLLSNLKKTLEKIEKRRASGSAGGTAKVLKSHGADVANATSSLQQNSTDVPETKTETQNRRTESKKEPSLRSVALVNDWPDGAFDEFYKKYPHKVGRQAAIKAFAKAKRAARAPWSRVIAALDRYIVEKPLDRAWCNPATWLNEGRYDDEPAALVRSTGPPGRGGDPQPSFREIAANLRNGNAKTPILPDTEIDTADRGFDFIDHVPARAVDR